MDKNEEKFFDKLRKYFYDSWVGNNFLNKSFGHYLWTGGLFTILNIFLVWLFIEVFEISTLISSALVIGGLFITRYLVYRWLKVM